MPCKSIHYTLMAKLSLQLQSIFLSTICKRIEILLTFHRAQEILQVNTGELIFKKQKPTDNPELLNRQL